MAATLYKTLLLLLLSCILTNAKSQQIDSITIKKHITDVWWSYMRYNSEDNTTLWIDLKKGVVKSGKTEFILKSDQTYQFTQKLGCASDRKISPTGKWHISNDTLYFTNRPDSSYLKIIDIKKGVLTTN